MIPYGTRVRFLRPFVYNGEQGAIRVPAGAQGAVGESSWHDEEREFVWGPPSVAVLLDKATFPGDWYLTIDRRVWAPIEALEILAGPAPVTPPHRHS